MIGLRNTEENDYLKDLVVYNEILTSPVSYRNNKMYSPLNYNYNNLLNSDIIQENIYSKGSASKALSLYSIIGNLDITKLNGPGYYITGCEVLNSSRLLYERSVANLDNNLLQFPTIINDLNKNISNLELQISSELRLLSEQEAKWTSLFDFAEEYKEVFEITDEELWLEFGNELNKYAYEIDFINLTKRLFNVTKYYVKLVRKNLSYIFNRLRVSRICNLIHQIAFSTKNLDDEHYSKVKTFDYQVFTNSRIVFDEKNNINKTFTVSLQEGFTERAERCYPRSNQAN